MFTSRRTAATATAAALLILLSGCGGSSGSDATAPKVASVPQASAGATPGAKGSDSGKDTTPSGSVVDPQLRLDSTKADIDRAYKAYYACWEKKGVPKTSISGQEATVLLTYKLHTKKYQAAVDACADAEPRTPPELDPAKNPKYWDQLREQLRCVKAQGLPMTIMQGNPGLFVGGKGEQRDFDKVNSPRGQKIFHECEKKAFAGK